MLDSVRTGEGFSRLPLALIGMSLQQDNPGGLLSSRARFRFSCHAHSAIELVISAREFHPTASCPL
jgi:hypothetical protein